LEEAAEHAPDLGHATELLLVLRVVDEEAHHRVLRVVEHDLVQVLPAKGREVVVPCGLHRRRRIRALGGGRRGALGDDDVLAHDLQVLAEDEGVRGRLVAAAGAFPREEHLPCILLHVDDGRLERALVRQLLEQAGEHLADLAHSLEDLLLLLVVDEETHYRLLGVVEHDLIQVLLAERAEVVVPCRLHGRRRVRGHAGQRAVGRQRR